MVRAVPSPEFRSRTAKQRGTQGGGSKRSDNSTVPRTDKENCRSRKNIDSSSVVVGPCVAWKLPTFTGKRKRRQTSSTSKGTSPRVWPKANICRFELTFYALHGATIRQGKGFKRRKKNSDNVRILK